MNGVAAKTLTVCLIVAGFTHKIVGHSDEEDFTALRYIPGEPGIDYPTLGKVPSTQFFCRFVPPGFYADVEAACQVWHYCDLDGRRNSFLCPNGTIFNQLVLTCDWWYNVDCSFSPNAYVVNLDLFKPNQPR